MGFFERFKKLKTSGFGQKFLGSAVKCRAWTQAFLYEKLRAMGGKVLPSIQKLPRNFQEFKHLPWDQIINQARKLALTKAYGAYLRLATATFAAYFLADTVSLFTDVLVPDPPPVPAPKIAPKETKRRSMSEFDNIVSRNIFNSKGLIPEEDMDLASGPARKTSLPFNLIGTVVLKDELKSIAAIEDKSLSMVFPVRIDDVIDNKAKITKIEHLKVYFINQSTGYLEYVEIVDEIPRLNAQVQTFPAKKGTGGVRQQDDTHYDVDRTSVDKALGNLSELLQQARAVPNFENGVPDGFRLLQITPGSLYDQIGLKNNDVLCGLNGEPISDPGKAFQIFNELKTASHIEVCIKRAGRKMNLSYDIR